MDETTRSGAPGGAQDAGAATEILTLALRLQTQSEQNLPDAHLVELGQELGIRPEYIREALLLQARGQSASSLPINEPAVVERASIVPAVRRVGITLVYLASLGLIPRALSALGDHPGEPLGVAICAVFWAVLCGLAAGEKWVARVAGVLAVPLVWFLASLYEQVYPGSLGIFLLAFAPLAASAGDIGGRTRRFGERLRRKCSGPKQLPGRQLGGSTPESEVLFGPGT